MQKRQTSNVFHVYININVYTLAETVSKQILRLLYYECIDSCLQT